MIRYVCSHCGVYFDEPVTRLIAEHNGEISRTYTEEFCPACHGDSFEAADYCPKCGDPKPTGHILCRSCRRSLRKRFDAFADLLTSEEAQQMDEWLDGSSITDRRNWT